MSAADAAGTWFSTSYYGHHRSKPRHDLFQEYRRFAKPCPPRQFIRWIRKSPDTHKFSNHDNRHSFPTDASYFDSGMGRRRGDEWFTRFRPDLIAWMPHAKELKGVIPASSYRSDYHNNKPIVQRIAPRIRSAAVESKDAAHQSRTTWMSEYGRHYQHDQPRPRQHVNMHTGRRSVQGVDVAESTHQYINPSGKLNRSDENDQNRIMRRAKSAPAFRYSVGDCLVWPQPPAPPARKFPALRNGAVTVAPPLEPKPVDAKAASMTPQATQVNQFLPPQAPAATPVAVPVPSEVKFMPHPPAPVVSDMGKFAPHPPLAPPPVAVAG